jgi:hypothetical protein
MAVLLLCAWAAADIYVARSQAYLMDGCGGSFEAFASTYTETAAAAAALSALTQAATTRGVSTPLLLAVSSACGAVALVAGFVAGQQERRALGVSGESSPLMRNAKQDSI